MGNRVSHYYITTGFTKSDFHSNCVDYILLKDEENIVKIYIPDGMNEVISSIFESDILDDDTKIYISRINNILTDIRFTNYCYTTNKRDTCDFANHSDRENEKLTRLRFDKMNMEILEQDGLYYDNAKSKLDHYIFHESIKIDCYRELLNMPSKVKELGIHNGIIQYLIIDKDAYNYIIKNANIIY